MLMTRLRVRLVVWTLMTCEQPNVNGERDPRVPRLTSDIVRDIDGDQMVTPEQY